MWPLCIVALCSALAALHSRGVSDGSTLGAQDLLPGNNGTSLENGSSRTGEGQEQSGPWTRKWGAKSTPPPSTPLQNSTDYKAGGAVAPTISVLTENGTCTFLLTCALAEGAVGQVAFSWQLANGSEVLSNGPTLRITWSPQQGAPDYVCTVRGGQGAHGSSRVSLREHCQEDPPITDKRISASFYAKSIVPILVVMVALAVLFLMYRRKRGRETHSSMESINESSVSESDHEARSSTADQVAEAGFLPQAWKPFGPEDGDTPEATAAIAHPEPPRA